MTFKAARILVLALLLAALLIFASLSGAVQAVVEMILSGHKLAPQGTPVPATHATLSEHEAEYIKTLAPQQQAEELIKAAINHDAGATQMVMDSLENWKGNLKRTKTWETLEQTGLYSNDLRVRAAVIEVDLVTYDVQKTPEWA